MKMSGSCNAIGPGTTECRSGGWKVLSIDNASVAPVTGRPIGSRSAGRAVLPNGTGASCIMAQEGGVCLCDRTPDAAVHPRGGPPALVDPRVSLGSAPERSKPTPHQENANETNHQVMGTQAPAQVRVERRRCGNGRAGTERIRLFIRRDLWPGRTDRIVRALPARTLEQHGAKERRGDRPEVGRPGAGPQSSAFPERLSVG